MVFMIQACDRLNTWRSDIGKRGIYCLEQYFKAPEYIKDRDARATFVKAQVPYIRDGDDKPMFPLIYQDSEVSKMRSTFTAVSHSCELYCKKLKGAWEAPLLTSILSKHIQRVGADHFLAFGKPSGMLALCAASVSTLCSRIFQG